MHPYPMLCLVEPPQLPAINECILCTRCGQTYRVLAHLDRGLSLLPSNNHETDARETTPWCPECATAEERERGATFAHGKPPSWVQLRAALKEALAMLLEDGVEIGQVNAARAREMRKLVEP